MIYNLVVNINRVDRKFIDKFHTFSANNEFEWEHFGGSAARPYQESVLAVLGEYFERNAVFALNRNLGIKERVGC